MDSGDLRIFESVARLGGMSRAATELNTVQSNVTARIRVLEGQLETSLFERHSRGVILTPGGGIRPPFRHGTLVCVRTHVRGRRHSRRGVGGA